MKNNKLHFSTYDVHTLNNNVIFFFFRFTDSNDHGKLRKTYRREPEILFLPEGRALLGTTGPTAGRRGRGRGGKHAVRGRAHQGTDEEFHQHVLNCTGRVRPILPVVRIHHIVRELSVDRGRRLLYLLEVVSVRTMAD